MLVGFQSVSEDTLETESLKIMLEMPEASWDDMASLLWNTCVFRILKYNNNPLEHDLFHEETKANICEAKAGFCLVDILKLSFF